MDMANKKGEGMEKKWKETGRRNRPVGTEVYLRFSVVKEELFFLLKDIFSFSVFRPCTTYLPSKESNLAAQ